MGFIFLALTGDESSTAVEWEYPHPAGKVEAAIFESILFLLH
jgi:hypothetical protein